MTVQQQQHSSKIVLPATGSISKISVQQQQHSIKIVLPALQCWQNKDGTSAQAPTVSLGCSGENPRRKHGKII
jgi:hypothetical protein